MLGAVRRSERVGAALAGEPDKDAATVIVEDLRELVGGVGQGAGGGDFVGLTTSRSKATSSPVDAVRAATRSAGGPIAQPRRD